jgi:hypothetical protein
MREIEREGLWRAAEWRIFCCIITVAGSSSSPDGLLDVSLLFTGRGELGGTTVSIVSPPNRQMRLRLTRVMTSKKERCADGGYGASHLAGCALLERVASQVTSEDGPHRAEIRLRSERRRSAKIFEGRFRIRLLTTTHSL